MEPGDEADADRGLIRPLAPDLVLAADLRAGQRHGHRAPHEDIVPLAKEIGGGRNRPEEGKRHDPHGRDDDIAAVTQGWPRTGPDDGTKEQTHLSPDRQCRPHQASGCKNYADGDGSHRLPNPAIISSQRIRRLPGPTPNRGLLERPATRVPSHENMGCRHGSEVAG